MRHLCRISNCIFSFDETMEQIFSMRKVKGDQQKFQETANFNVAKSTSSFKNSIQNPETGKYKHPYDYRPF